VLYYIKMPNNNKLTEAQMYWKIKYKWAKETKSTDGWFLQHIDGNTLNNINNLKKIHPHEVFMRLYHGEYDLVVNWFCGLTDKEIYFVYANAYWFAKGYSNAYWFAKGYKNKKSIIELHFPR